MCQEELSWKFAKILPDLFLPFNKNQRGGSVQRRLYYQLQVSQCAFKLKDEAKVGKQGQQLAHRAIKVHTRQDTGIKGSIQASKVHLCPDSAKIGQMRTTIGYIGTPTGPTGPSRFGP